MISELSIFLLTYFEDKLPDGIEIHHIDHQCIFPIQGGIGAIYLIRRGKDPLKDPWYSYCIRFSNPGWDQKGFAHILVSRIEEGVKEFQQFLQEGVARPLDPDGGDFGIGLDNKVEK